MNGFNHLIQEFTRVTESSKTAIDLAFVNTSERIVASGTIPIGISDHFGIFVVRKAGVLKPSPRVNESRSYKKQNKEAFVRDLQQVPWNIIKQFDCINDAVDMWQKLFTDVANVHPPLRRMRVKCGVARSISDELRDEMKLRDFYLSKYTTIIEISLRK